MSTCLYNENSGDECVLKDVNANKHFIDVRTPGEFKGGMNAWS
ncbi:hypothetical protein P4H39_23655 [Paenibacillus lautus]|nr:hypothetical protein [Paenibacillus lautus]MEC0205608.1 hypothetical protein [Paenibacillus lautus]